MDTTQEPTRILSFCTGIRKLERGLERTIGEVRTVAYVEIEAFLVENLVAEMEQGLLAPAPIWSNLKTFDARPFRGKIHGIIGGYPCQPFSLAGKRGAESDPRHLWPYFERSIEAARPIFCFLENVEGHIELGYPSVYASLRKMGYSVEAGMYSAEETGAPHQRNRLFILAIRTSELEHSQGGWTGRLRDSVSAREGHGTTETSKILDYPSGIRPESEHQIPTGRNGAELTSENELGNPSLIGMEGMWTSGQSQSQSQSQIRKRISGCSGINGECWPAKPGEQQYEWEEPRVIEPKMGVSSHGYDFQEDLLRALGNAVVEQTAEIAARDLLTKHIKNFKQ